MGTQATTFTTVGINAYLAGEALNLDANRSALWTLTGTLDATCVLYLERSTTGGLTWEVVQTFTAGVVTATGTVLGKYIYRFRLQAGATAQSSSLTASIADAVDTLYEILNPSGLSVFKVTETGIVSPTTTALQTATTPAVVSLTDAATIATDASLGTVFTVTLGGNRTLGNPTNMVAGQLYRWIIVQDGTGTRTLAYGSAFTWPAGSVPTVTATAAAISVINALYDGSKLRASAQLAFA